MFAAIVGFVTYEVDKLLYTSAAPANFINYSVIAALLPFLAAAVVAFAVAFIISMSTKSEDKTEVQTETQSTKEADIEETST